MPLPKARVDREQMMRRVVRFVDLKGYDGGLPDSKYPGCERVIYNVLGFQPPKGGAASVVSPVGAQAAAMAGIAIQEGFNIGYAECAVGKGPLMHNHDTNETFIPITGQWRFEWEVDGRVERIDLGPLDTIAMPAGVNRRFENITKSEPDKTHLLMGIIAGDAPGAEFSEGAVSMLKKKGLA
jgi:mannose-6-phosphate isomerase-like protein (cupin superfamily)